MHYALVLFSVMAVTPSGWNATFAPQTLATYLTGSDLRLVVVTAGTDSADAREATEALVSAFKATKKTRVVVSSASLGKFTDLDDQTIVRKCEKLPLDIIVTVRTFDATVIVTFYDKSAEVQNAFTAQKSTEIAARSAEDAAPKSRANNTIGRMVERDESGEAPPHPIGNAAYDKAFIGFQNWVVVNGSGQSVGMGSQPFQGKYQRRLKDSEFYALVERPDLLEQYNAKQKLRAGLGFGGGIGVTVVGVALMTVGLVLNSQMPRQFGLCDTTFCGFDAVPGLGWGLASTGIVLTAAGSAMGYAALFINPNPVQMHEKLELADQYNQRLRKRTREAEPEVRKTSLNFSPTFTTNGAGLTVVGTF